MENGQPTYFHPCPNNYTVKDRSQSETLTKSLIKERTQRLAEWDIFQKTKDDERTAQSIEDRLFLQIMDREVYKGRGKFMGCPTPIQAAKAISSKQSSTSGGTLQFTSTIFQEEAWDGKRFCSLYGEAISKWSCRNSSFSWSQGTVLCIYLLLLCTIPKNHPRSEWSSTSSAQCKGASLNKVLLTGPDLNNSLLRVLMRFRKEPVAFMVDIQQNVSLL